MGGMKELPTPLLPLLRPLPLIAPRRFDTPHPAQTPGGLTVCWARHADEVSAAQRLRHLVFAEEMGARLTPPPGTPVGHDVDRFDAYCEHLIVRTPATDGAPADVVGTYRVLTPGGARRAGGWYSDTEFDLAPLQPLRARTLELGRSCIHPAHRQGGVIMALWAALARFMAQCGLDTTLGCASIPMHDGGHSAAAIWRDLAHTHLAPQGQRVLPRLPLPVGALGHGLRAEPPALIKGYLRCGAQVLGAPAWDPDFNTADLPLMMQLANLPARYRRHFMGPLV